MKIFLLKCKFIIIYLNNIEYNNKSHSIHIDVCYTFTLQISDKNKKSSRHLHVINK